jgi:hypothetical protein
VSAGKQHQENRPSRPSQQPGTVALHRLSGFGSHFYTTSEAEKESALSAGWTWEKVAGWVFPTPQADARPIFRLLKIEPDPSFPDDPKEPVRLAQRNIAWSQLRDQKIMPWPDEDAFHLDVTDLMPPVTPGVGPEVDFHFGVGSNISWWKEIRLFGSDGKPFGQGTVPQDPGGRGLAIVDTPGWRVFVGRYPISRLVGCRFVFSKAKQFEVHTGMYELHLGDARWLGGKTITFAWIKD